MPHDVILCRTTLLMEIMTDMGCFQQNNGVCNSHACFMQLKDKREKTNRDRIPSTSPGAEPPRDARNSGSARSHSTHLETSSPDRPKMVTYMEPKTVSSYMYVTCTRRTLRMPNFTRETHAQPSLSNFPWRDSDFGERTHSRGTTNSDKIFQLPPQIKRPNLHIVRYTCQCEQYQSHR